MHEALAGWVLRIEHAAIIADTRYQYAAHSRAIRVTPGDYAVRLTTIDGREPFTHDGPDQTVGKPYYAVADVLGLVVGGHRDVATVGDSVTHRFEAYAYQLQDGRAVLFGRVTGPATNNPVGRFVELSR